MYRLRVSRPGTHLQGPGLHTRGLRIRTKGFLESEFSPFDSGPGPRERIGSSTQEGTTAGSGSIKSRRSTSKVRRSERRRRKRFSLSPMFRCPHTNHSPHASPGTRSIHSPRRDPAAPAPTSSRARVRTRGCAVRSTSRHTGDARRCVSGRGRRMSKRWHLQRGSYRRSTSRQTSSSPVRHPSV